MKHFLALLILIVNYQAIACDGFIFKTFPMTSAEKVAKAIKQNLSDDLLTPEWRQIKQESGNQGNKYFGQCYVSSEAFYHLMGGKEVDLVPQHLPTEFGTHWIVFNRKTGKRYDLTRPQFKETPNYSTAVNAGFLTKLPSKRAQKLILKVLETLRK
ncbi:MAG: hypothetical protein JNM93_03620 [Bacteriovoracaceae bacterium]|nr:hypothetical protein [Bacteriovoracaceae bacterium]